MDIHLKDIHLVVTHMLPSTFDGEHVFGEKYPLCQYTNGTWFRHSGPHVQVKVSDEVGVATCGLCAVLMGREKDAKTTT